MQECRNARRRDGSSDESQGLGEAEEKEDKWTPTAHWEGEGLLFIHLKYLHLEGRSSTPPSSYAAFHRGRRRRRRQG
jgi:hypothetical protein